jgi:glycosyltransferase involved in cell wall biosynthesis
MGDTFRLRSLYICYLSLEDPLVHTQVVAYLRGLAADGHCVHLLTFETSRLSRSRRAELRDGLAADGVLWHGLRYHKRPSLPATVYDTLAGAVFATMLLVRHRLDALHARAHVPAAMALIVRRLVWPRRPALIFDIRGLMAEEYEDAGRWTRDGIPFRLTKLVERSASRRAEGIVVLTDRIRRQLFGPDPSGRVSVIPCCADLEALAAARGERDHRRTELGLGEATLMIYVGKFGGWYMAAEMADFFAIARRLISNLHFLILTQGERDQIRHALERHGMDDRDYTIASAPPEQLGGYLAAADFGISFIRPTPSKASSSPTKVGEYLGAGLPVVCTSGVGDLDAMIAPGIGTLVSQHTQASYEAAVDHIAQLLADDDTEGRCRAVAERELSLSAVGVPRYRELYEHVANAISATAIRGRRARRSDHGGPTPPAP